MSVANSINEPDANAPIVVTSSVLSWVVPVMADTMARSSFRRALEMSGASDLLVI